MMSSLLADWNEYEQNFRGQAWIDWTRDHAEIPIFSVSVYLAIVFYGPGLLDGRKFNLRTPVAVWNLLLAVFSTIGAYKTVPVLYHSLLDKGFVYTACTDPEQWYADGPVGLWVGLFIFSKLPELIDTVFLVLRGRDVIFLHWFHHLTVLLYCWHAYHNRVASGLWFAAMNFSVHAIMYTYYFLMACKLYAIATPCALSITTCQILQMALGSAVTLTSARKFSAGGRAACFVDPANYKMGLAMYASYFCLFGVLFWNKYVVKHTATRVSGPNQKEATTLCGVDLRNGDITGRFNQAIARNNSIGDLKQASIGSNTGKKKTK